VWTSQNATASVEGGVVVSSLLALRVKTAHNGVRMMTIPEILKELEP
jgi:hypothetical protein